MRTETRLVDRQIVVERQQYGRDHTLRHEIRMAAHVSSPSALPLPGGSSDAVTRLGPLHRDRQAAAGARMAPMPRERRRRLLNAGEHCTAKKQLTAYSVIACDKRKAFAQGSEATKQSMLPVRRYGLLRCARNDGKNYQVAVPF